MSILIIDIRENCLRAVLSNDGILEYSRMFDIDPLPQPTADALPLEVLHKDHAASEDAPYRIYYDPDKKNSRELILKQILKQIRSDIKGSIDSTHLIIPSDEVIVGNYQLPKMSRPDAVKIIGRKISVETKEEYPPFTIIPAASDQKSQSWYSLYIPTATLRDYRKVFASGRMRLRSITTPVNAMIDAFRSVRESIFTTHAVFEIQRGFIEAFYISADGMLHFQRLPYATSATSQGGSAEEAEKAHKLKIFKIINTIFIINSEYQSAHPETPVQMVWLCGFGIGLPDIAAALKDAMGIEVGIAPAVPTGLPDASAYVPLAGFATSLHSNTATTYEAADLFRRFPLRKTSSAVIFAVTACAALLTIILTEREYRKIQNQVQQIQQSQGQKLDKNKASASAAYTKNLEAIKRLTSRQFIFYNLFRELATDLPDGVYLENLEFHLKEDKGFIDITALARLDDKIAESMLLSRLVAMYDRSPALKNHREPTITVFAKDKERYLKIIITSEVNPLDTAK